MTFVVHWTSWGPRVSGMYESVKDQIKAERAEGLRSEFGEPNEEKIKDEWVDDWLTPITWDEAKKADIWVLHAKFPDTLNEFAKTKVRVAVLHGPSEHLIFKEWTKSGGSLNTHVSLLWDMDATVCINTHEYDIMKIYDEKVDKDGKGRCHYIPNSIDLERVKDVHPWAYDNHPAIISCDTPRVEKLPTHIVWAMPYLRMKIPTAKLNIYSLLLEPINQWRNLFVRAHLRELERACENIQLANNNLFPFQKGADIGFNNNYSGIASRVTMEMMSMGTPVVSYNGDYTKYHAKAFDLHSIAEQLERCWQDLTAEGSTLIEETLEYARENFDRSKEVKKYVKLYTELLEKKRGG